jgi:hypothetical protein
METLGLICLLIGVVIALIYGLKLLILAFRTSILWGLGYLLVPFVGLIFVIVHWDKAGSPFLRSLLAIPFYALGVLLSQPV